jgi:hypothetical protein
MFIESRSKNLLSSRLVSPYRPTIFSARYSGILARTTGGRLGAESMRVIVLAERPEPLCMPWSRAQVVLRESLKISACWSSVSDLAASVSLSSRIRAVCRARPVRELTSEKRESAEMDPFERNPPRERRTGIDCHRTEGADGACARCFAGVPGGERAAGEAILSKIARSPTRSLAMSLAICC